MTEPHNDITTLQSLIWPEAQFSVPDSLYLRLLGQSKIDPSGIRLSFASGDVIRTDTAFNLFNLGKWQRHCGIEDLQLRIEGDGTILARVMAQTEGTAPQCLVSRELELEPERGVGLAFSLPDDDIPTLLHLEIEARTAGHLSTIDWQTRQPPRRHPDLMVAVTTFRREANARATAERFAAYLRTVAIKEHLHLTIVDNGQSLNLPDLPSVRVLPNANLGGSGGFARGMMEARASGASHCLFMDDDAAIHMQSLERSWAFLAYAIRPDTAVAGALSMAAVPWRLWENGAVFNGLCRPEYNGLDLQNPERVAEMEWETTAAPPENFYAGWWYFAFPLAHANHMPFPYFIRGDDVGFGLIHDFNIVRLPGVLCFQDQDFSAKETAMTLYLDLRSHMGNLLSLPSLERGRFQSARIALWFFARALIGCHYETIAALNLALRDVLEGPDFFVRNIDMQARRTEIAALYQTEAYRPHTTPDQPDRQWINPNRFLPRFAMKLTINGHLLPGFGWFGNRITATPGERGRIRLLWGISRMTFLSADGTQSYTVTHSKKRAFLTSTQFLWTLLRFLLRYRDIRARWRKGYWERTTEESWTALFSQANGGARE